MTQQSKSMAARRMHDMRLRHDAFERATYDAIGIRIAAGLIRVPGDNRFDPRDGFMDRVVDAVMIQGRRNMVSTGERHGV